ncbi:c6 transcription factor [Lasallia pustulata]|uniref:C6 transcription factor n=1 Tax=Lasallia pustulata TaxID=136370 RepID=A0A1W5D9N4_9LECA|nr:c6 transcription factor [Lasallia pustulata]
MNTLHEPALGLPTTGLPPTNPSSTADLQTNLARNNSALASPTATKAGGRKRTQSWDTSPGSVEDGDDEDGQEERRRQPGVKRACNECRQQKLRCNVVQEPFSVCSRCQRLNLECKIESSFKRIGKRSKNAEMEREIVELRRQLAAQHASPIAQHTTVIKAPTSNSQSPNISHIPSTLDQYMGSQEAVASLLDLRSGLDGGAYLRSPSGQMIPPKRLENVVLIHDRVQELFRHFFTFYYPFLPLLEPDKSPDYYYDASPLLFWTVVAVAARRYHVDANLLNSLIAPMSRLLWATISDVPQSYHVVKALCILCTWPLPISSTSSDPTFMLSGLMMQIAMQIGLHRPSHAQDFTKFRVELREEELKDRVKTWATCNVVAQRVATGYGQPPSTYYDWSLITTNSNDANFKLPEEIEARLLIERFSDKVTRSLYSNRSDAVGLVADTERSILTTFLARDFEELEQKLQPNIPEINSLYLRAAYLHLRLSALFDSPTSKDYRSDLLALWLSATSFLECALTLESAAGPILTYSTNYIMQMIVAAGFTLLKLLNSFFANHVDLEYGKNLFNRTIWAIRTISVSMNDLPSRLAEVLAQLWRGGGAGSLVASGNERGAGGSVDGSLMLKVRCRMSMSLVFDSVWRWREEFQAKGKGNLESTAPLAPSPPPLIPHSLRRLPPSLSTRVPPRPPPPPLARIIPRSARLGRALVLGRGGWA